MRHKRFRTSGSRDKKIQFVELVNKLEVEVTNLPANRIADPDRKGGKWRKYKEINLVDLNYKKTGYAHWQLVESGLNSVPRLRIMK